MYKKQNRTYCVRNQQLANVEPEFKWLPLLLPSVCTPHSMLLTPCMSTCVSYYFIYTHTIYNFIFCISSLIVSDRVSIIIILVLYDKSLWRCNLLSHPFTVGYLGYFYCFNTVNNAAINTGIASTFFSLTISFECIPKIETLSCVLWLMLSLFKNLYHLSYCL